MADETKDFLINTPATPRHRYGLLIGFVILMIVVVGIAIFVYVQRQPVGEGQMLVDPFAGWITYQSEALGFELKHPADGQIIKAASQELVRVPGQELPYAGTIMVVRIPQDLDIDSKTYLTQRVFASENAPVLLWTGTEFADREAEITNYITPGYASGSGKILLFKGDKSDYAVIRIVVDSRDSDYLLNLTELMLSTFKFSN